MEAPNNWEEVLSTAVLHGQALLERNAELQVRTRGPTHASPSRLARERSAR